VLYNMPSMVRDEEERRAKEAHLEAILRLCRISGLRDKMPSQLSGGERQRVALARAIAAGFGRLLMLDEPFTGMDGALRDELIAELKEWQAKQGAPILMVTHDLGEVFATGAEVMRMKDGRIVAVGPAEVVLAAERERLLRMLGSAADPLRG
jgi:molybdate transport system ATP-binding protein